VYKYLRQTSKNCEKVKVAKKKKLESDEYVLAGLGLAGVLAIALKALLKR
jgi:hypothetical protein